MDEPICDVVIVGGGPAGLSAALLLGRCRRRVIVCDNGQYRNAVAKELHGFLTRDGIPPAEFRQIAKEQLRRYEIEIWNVHVQKAACKEKLFELTLADGRSLLTRKLLLATGICDEWPQLDGAKELYGKSIFHCPYCDGWEVRDQPLAVYGNDNDHGELALNLMLWSKEVILCTNGPSQLSPDLYKKLQRYDVGLNQQRIAKLEGKEGILEQIIFENGEKLSRRALFFHPKSTQRSDLATQLGCARDEKGSIKTGKYEVTSLPGVFVAGDTSRNVFQAIVGAGEGAEAAFAINTSLLNEELI